MRRATLRAALVAALLGLPLAVVAQPGPPPPSPPVGSVNVDGTLTDTPYTLLGTNAGAPAPSFSNANQLTALYAYVDVPTNSLYLGIGGNVFDGNRIVVFVDSRAGGYASGDYGRTEGPNGVRFFNSGHRFDAGFTADFAVSIGAFQGNVFVNVTELSGTSGGGGSTDRYIGDAVGSPDIAVLSNEDPANRTRGVEIRIPFSGTASAATPLASDRHSMQFFSLLSGDNQDGFLSNTFLTPAPASQTASYGFATLDFETLQQDPLSYVWQPVEGRKGWRHLAWPVTGGSVAFYAGQNFVRGPGTNFPSGASNVILRRNGAQYEYAAGLGDALPSGRGQFWYHYDASDFPGGTPPPGSNFQSRPYTLRAGGLEPQADVSVGFSEAPTGGFVMAGNPFSLDFDTQGVAAAGYTVGPLAYVWDPDASTAGGYVVVDRNARVVADRTVAPMQGFWIEAVAVRGGALSPTFAQASRVQGNEPLLSREGSTLAAQRVLGFAVERIDAAGLIAEWGVARLAFVDGAGEGTDAFDGGQPPALDSSSEVRLAVVGAEGQKRGQESRAFSLTGPVDVRLALRIAGRASGQAYRLSWPTVIAIPAEWALTLRDGDTGAVVDLRSASHYDFVASPADWDERFTVRVAPRATAAEAAPTATRLGPARPNPATRAARLALRVDRPQTVRADLFDALGRQVATVFDGLVEGERDVVVDTRGLAPGLYVLRVAGETFLESRTVTVSR